MDTKQVLADLKSATSESWLNEGDLHKLRLFIKVAENVPAYKDFLAQRNIDPNSIKTTNDFKSLPSVNKKNYLNKYTLDQLSWNGSLLKPLVFTSTSGSTSAPIYFHRSFKLDWQASVIHELFFNHSSSNNHSPVLVVVCFGMGVWIGGLITYQSFYQNLQRGYEFSIITPGINKKEIFNALKQLSCYYKQIILTGYPPFIKDIIDEAPEYGIDFNKLHTRILFAAESFTEDFRDYIIKGANIQCPYRDTMNIYGSADLGAMAFETPIAILIRRLLRKKPDIFQTVFGQLSKTPTLAQHFPTFTSFETSEDGRLLLTGDNSIPLIKYDIGDSGGVIAFDEMVEILESYNLDLESELSKIGLKDYYYQLPFVFIYERSDFSTNLYGLNIYPEPIRETLLNNPFCDFLTGKFVLETKFDLSQNQYWVINLELRKGKKVSDNFEKILLNQIVKYLENYNSEYRELHCVLKERALPTLVFHEAENSDFFKLGAKQEWVRKQLVT